MTLASRIEALERARTIGDAGMDLVLLIADQPRQPGEPDRVNGELLDDHLARLRAQSPAPSVILTIR
jgi:hypothetical protein